MCAVPFPRRLSFSQHPLRARSLSRSLSPSSPLSGRLWSLGLAALPSTHSPQPLAGNVCRTGHGCAHGGCRADRGSAPESDFGTWLSAPQPPARPGRWPQAQPPHSHVARQIADARRQRAESREQTASRIWQTISAQRAARDYTAGRAAGSGVGLEGAPGARAWTLHGRLQE